MRAKIQYLGQALPTRTTPTRKRRSVSLHPNRWRALLCHCHRAADADTHHADAETTERFPPQRSLEGNALPLPPSCRCKKHPALALCPNRHKLPLCTARVENIRLVSPFITQKTAPTLCLLRFAPASVRQFWPITPRTKSFVRHGAPPIIGQSVAM